MTAFPEVNFRHRHLLLRLRACPLYIAMSPKHSTRFPLSFYHQQTKLQTVFFEEIRGLNFVNSIAMSKSTQFTPTLCPDSSRQPPANPKITLTPSTLCTFSGKTETRSGVHQSPGEYWLCGRCGADLWLVALYLSCLSCGHVRCDYDCISYDIPQWKDELTGEEHENWSKVFGTLRRPHVRLA